jgi:hypothetical protein
MNRAREVRPNKVCFFNARLVCKPRSRSGRFLCPLQGRVFGDFLTALTQYYLSSPYKSQSMMPGAGSGAGGLLPGQIKAFDIGKCIAVEHEDLVREFWHTGRIPNKATCEALSASLERFKDVRFAHKYGQD